MRWIKDEEFIRGSIPMTKYELRVITMAMLEIESGDVLLDVGAGTGSISVEAALQGARVYALEREAEGVGLIRANAERFKVQGLSVIEDIAPAGIDRAPSFNKCFIGGSGGRLGEIVQAVTEKLPSGGLIVGNFVTLKNLTEFQSLLSEFKYRDLETRLIQSSVLQAGTGLMRANNPVFIVKGRM